MITVGGLTRITGSGLSITEWNPIMGAIPPISDAAWQDAFSKYQHIPQYIRQNRGMSLAEFKGIFWWEWAHRFLGRLLGVVFFAPFVWFAWMGAIKRAEWPRMLLLFALGGLQGFVGWWMVESGLETRVSVSQYRLAIHLGVALILLVAILWTALEYLRSPQSGRSHIAARWAGGGWAIAVVVLVYLQMLLGALVAGLHAGLIYNTWPLMDGRAIPEDALCADALVDQFLRKSRHGAVRPSHRRVHRRRKRHRALVDRAKCKTGRPRAAQRQCAAAHHAVPDRTRHRDAADAGAGVAGSTAPD